MVGAGLPLGTGQKCMALSFAESAGNMACSAYGTLMVVHNESAETVELDIHVVQLLEQFAKHGLFASAKWPNKAHHSCSYSGLTIGTMVHR